MLSTIENLTEELFQEEVQLTGITEFGISWVDMLNGKATIPHEGAKFNISFEGYVEGQGIKGLKRGVDYLEVRADGKFILDIYAIIETDDGENILMHEDGVLIPAEDGSHRGELKFNMSFHTSSTKYSWLNKTPVWAKGTVDMEKGIVKIKAYRV